LDEFLHQDPNDQFVSLLVMSIYLELVDDLCLETCFEMHRKLKLGLLCLNCDSVYSDVITRPNCDIFGQTINEIQNTESFECVNCKRMVMASRYAPHLEKCMGFGRNSSRIASKRLASSVSKKNSNESEESDSEDRDYNPLDKGKKKDKKSGKKTRKSKFSQ